MKNKTLQPLTDVKAILALPEIKYLPGFPRKYRFDAKNGKLNFNGQTDITGKGQSFNLISLAYRIFTDEILGYSRRKWAELFFVNQAGQLCSLLFHGFSVDQLQTILGDLYYEDAGLTDIQLTITPEPRSNEFGNYYVASFGFEVLPAEDGEQLALIAESMPPIYRQDIHNGDAQIHAWKHVQLPEPEFANRLGEATTSDEQQPPWEESAEAA